MDKTSESYAQKILAEIKRIGQIMERLPGPRTTSNQEAHEQQLGSSQGCNESKATALSKQIPAKDRPPNSHSDESDASNNDSYKWLKKHKPLVELLGLIFLVLYTTVAALQWCASSRQVDEARDANRLLDESIRAQPSIEGSLNPVEAGKPVSEDLTITNVGHSMATVATHFGYDRRVELPDGEMPLNVGSFDTLLEPSKPMYTAVLDPNPIPQSLLDNMTPLSDIQSMLSHKPRSVTIYLYGRIDYKTLGKTRTVEFCNFIVRNDHGVLFPRTPPNTPENTVASSKFTLFSCPKWNQHE